MPIVALYPGETAMTTQILLGQLRIAQQQNALCRYAAAAEMARTVVLDGEKHHAEGASIDIDHLRAFGDCVVADSLSKRGNFPAALPIAQSALQWYQQSDIPTEKIQCLLIIAETHRGLSDYTNAMIAARDAEAISLQLENQPYSLHISLIIGCILLDSHKFSDALEVLSRVSSVSQFANDPFVFGFSTVNAGACHQMLDNYQLAREHYQTIQSLFRDSEQVFMYASSLSALGSLALTQGDFLVALKYMEEALSIFRSIGSHQSVGKVLTSIASVYRMNSEFHLSIIYSMEALEVLEECGSIKQAATCLGNIAILNYLLNNFHEAEGQFLKVFEMFKEINVSYGHYLGNYGKLLYEHGYKEKGIQYLQQAIASFQESNSIVEECLYNYFLVDAAIDSRDFAKAKEIAFRKYRVLSEHDRKDQIPSELLKIGDLYANPDPETAERYYLNALEQYQEQKNNHGISVTLRKLAKFYQQCGRWKEYGEHIERSIEVDKKMFNEETNSLAVRVMLDRKIAAMQKEQELAAQQAENEKKLLEQRIAFQKREIEETIRELVAKNSLLHQVRKDVKLLSRYVLNGGSDIAEHLLDRLDRNILPIESNTNLEKQWLEVHGPFMEELHHRYPLLTAMELKVCALLKMKLTSSNICTDFCRNELLSFTD